MILVTKAVLTDIQGRMSLKTKRMNSMNVLHSYTPGINKHCTSGQTFKIKQKACYINHKQEGCFPNIQTNIIGAL